MAKSFGGFGPGGIDCGDVIDEIYVYMDDETDDATRGRIRQHLEACAPCLKQYGLEQDVRAMISRCCGGDRAPQSLHTRIRVRITELTVESGSLEYRAE
jgi:mycothiol system anti-sigma-R factor